jgi:CRP-like cAMP-binding protein
MSDIDQRSVENRLLRALPQQAYSLLAPHLLAIDLPLHHVLVEADQPTSHICFIESGLGSVVASSADDENIEVGHLGREGISGFHVLHMTDITPNKTFMQVAGRGLQLSVGHFNGALDQDPETRAFFLRYVQACEIQLAQSALANGRYLMHQRLARWLLMCHDRLGDDDLPLTHEFLAIMLGVRRSGVTDQIHVIEGEHAIRATRGSIRVTDREKLEEIAGGCYGIPEREYERLVGIPIRALPV